MELLYVCGLVGFAEGLEGIFGEVVLELTGLLARAEFKGKLGLCGVKSAVGLVRLAVLVLEKLLLVRGERVCAGREVVECHLESGRW